jgi:hypothetical protein
MIMLYCLYSSQALPFLCCMPATHTCLQAPEQLVSQQQPSATGLTLQEPLGSFCEFPAINPAQRGQQYRYAYCLSAVRPTNIGNALSKIDLQQGGAQSWHEPGGAVGELQAAGWLAGLDLQWCSCLTAWTCLLGQEQRNLL